MASDGTHTAAAEALNGLVAALVRSRPREMSLTAVATLSTLERTGPRRITELAVIEGVTQPSMTTLVSNLEKEGMVGRHSDPADGRATLVAITDAGTAFMRGRRERNTASLERLIAKLEDGEKAALNSAITAVIRLTQLDEDERDPTRAST